MELETFHMIWWYRHGYCIFELPYTVTCSKSENDLYVLGGIFQITDSQLKKLMNGVDKFRIHFSDDIIDGNFGENVEDNPEEIDYKFCFKELSECLYAGLASLEE